MVTTVEGKKELRTLVNPPKTSVIGVNQAGCTANVVLITESYIYCANAGDARSVASINGKALELSKDHKPTLP